MVHTEVSSLQGWGIACMLIPACPLFTADIANQSQNFSP